MILCEKKVGATWSYSKSAHLSIEEIEIIKQTDRKLPSISICDITMKLKCSFLPYGDAKRERNWNEINEIEQIKSETKLNTFWRVRLFYLR